MAAVPSTYAVVHDKAYQCMLRLPRSAATLHPGHKDKEVDVCFEGLANDTNRGPGNMIPSACFELLLIRPL